MQAEQGSISAEQRDAALASAAAYGCGNPEADA